MPSTPTAGLKIVPVHSAAELKRFIRLPAKLHADDPQFVPPLELEREESYSPKKNPLFAHCEVQFWLAVRDGIDVGRISAQIDTLSPMHKDEAAGFFGAIAAIDDSGVFDALFATAEGWLRERGCRKVYGPFHLSINEETGLLVAGFESKPMLLMGHDKPYIGGRIEALGYAKARDMFAYLYDITHELRPAVRRFLDRPLPQGLVLRPMDLSRYADEVRTITTIFNDAWADNWGFVPFTDAEVDHLGKALKPILDPKLVAIAEWNGEAVGFGVTLPNINEAIGDLNGKLLPFGWAKLLWRLKVRDVKSARVPLMGVKRSLPKGFASSLIPLLIIEAMRQRALQRGFQQVELSWILEDNLPMRHMIEAFGAEAYRTYRVYQKAFA